MTIVQYYTEVSRYNRNSPYSNVNIIIYLMHNYHTIVTMSTPYNHTVMFI